MNKSDREIFRMFIFCFFGHIETVKEMNEFSGEFDCRIIKDEFIDAFPENEYFQETMFASNNYIPDNVES